MSSDTSAGWSLRGLTALLSAYSVAISFLYLTGFWGFFHINIFEYIGVTDFLKHALTGLVGSSFLVGISSIIGAIIYKPLQSALPPGGGAHLPEAKYFRFFYRSFMMAFIIFAALVYLYSKSPARSWIIGTLLFFPVYDFLMDNLAIVVEIPDYRERYVIVFVFLSIILYSNAWGIQRAQSIANAHPNFSIGDNSPKYTYIGRTDGHIFVWDNRRKETIIYLESTIDSYRIGKGAQIKK